jgi:uncharacterized RDD family membrane protein YckC
MAEEDTERSIGADARSGDGVEEDAPAVAATGAQSPFDPNDLPKASLLARLVAFIVDEIIAAGPMLLFGAIGYWAIAYQSVPDTWSLWVSIVAYSLGIFWPLFYMLTRDGWGRGQGWGKRLFGVMVVNAETGAYGTKGASAARTLVLLLILIVEAVVALVRPDGRRLGDLLAHTRVVSESDYAASTAPGAATVAAKPASKTGATVALILSAVLIAASVGLISFTVSRLAPAPVSDEVAAEVYDAPEERGAEETIELYYEDIRAGRYDDALSRFRMPQEQSFAIVAVYSDSDAVLDDYEIASVNMEGAEVVVTVDETFVAVDGNTLSRTVVYTLEPEGEVMYITAVASEEFDPIATAEAPIVYPRDAEVAVDAFLGFISVGDSANANELATERFINENPEYFDGSYGTLAKWDILGSEQLTSERMRVRVQEDWASASRAMDFQTTLVGGDILVDTASPVQ